MICALDPVQAGQEAVSTLSRLDSAW